MGSIAKTGGYTNVFGRATFAANASLGKAKAQALEGLRGGGLPNFGVNLNQNLSKALGVNIVSSPKMFTLSRNEASLPTSDYGFQLMAISRITNVSNGSVMTGYTGRSVLYKDLTLNLYIKKPVSSYNTTLYGRVADASCAHRIVVVQFHKPGIVPAVPSTFLKPNALNSNYWGLYRTDTADHYTVWLDRHVDLNDRYMSYLNTGTASVRAAEKPRSVVMNIYLQFNTKVSFSSTATAITPATANVTENMFYFFIFSAWSGYHLDNTIPRTTVKSIEVSQFYDD